MNELIETIFANFAVDGVDVPVSFLRYEGEKTTYVVYMQTDADNSFSGDDDLLGYVDYYDFDVYAFNNGEFGGNYFKIVQSIKERLKANGFTFQPSRTSSDMYETDTGYYHKTLCFAIPVQEIQEEI